MEDVFNIELIQTDKGFKIVNLKGKQLKDLPLEYNVAQRSKVYMNNTLNGSGMILDMNRENIYFNVGDSISREDTTLLIMTIKDANLLLNDIQTRHVDFNFDTYVVGVEEED